MPAKSMEFEKVYVNQVPETCTYVSTHHERCETEDLQVRAQYRNQHEVRHV